MSSKNTEDSHNLLEFCLGYEKVRLATFKDWPFGEGCRCSAQKMAQAGFYHCPTNNEPDVVRCFVCQKELDGWEPEDDPWKEHESHSSECPLLTWKESGITLLEDLTTDQFFTVMVQRYKCVLMKLHQSTLRDIKEHASEIRKEIDSFRK